VLSCRFSRLLAAILLLASLVVGGHTKAESTLRVATHAQLDSLDPIWTTAYITRTHGYLVYDTLFALDQNFDPQPQMVDTWTVSPDGIVYTFKLRPGLKWSDGTPVTADDCVASLERWGKRDGMGQQLFADVQSLTAPDAQTIRMQLDRPYGLVLESLGKLSSNVPFMMPKRIAETSAYTPIQDPTGSGPFKFVTSEWKPGGPAIYVKNPYYVPRSEPASLAAGGKVARVDRIELIHFSDPAAALKALIDGEVDYVESPPAQLIKTLEHDKDIVVASTDPLGNVGMMRFNMLQPPFDNPAIRRAVLMTIRQQDYMSAALGDQRYWRTCYSAFPCLTPLANDVGNDVIKTGSLDAARAALKAAHYDGTPVVILNPADIPVIAAFTKVTADNLRKIGMNVVVQDMDWQTLLKRRANRGPVSQGGWNMFHTWWMAADVSDPTGIAFSGNPQTGWYGWLNDPQLEADRADYAQSTTLEQRQEMARKVQERIWSDGAFGVLGQFFEPVAFRSTVKGITSPIQFFWNMSPE
jgi:peptide/nickel transport system substrate-binding protein